MLWSNSGVTHEDGARTRFALEGNLDLGYLNLGCEGEQDENRKTRTIKVDSERRSRGSPCGYRAPREHGE
jgi:hypothetical protein